MVQNKGLIFKKAPPGVPVAGEHIAVEAQEEFDLEAIPPKGGVTTKNFYVSFDPYQRGRMRNPEVNNKSYSAPFEIGKPVTNAALSKILKSDNEKLQPGDLVVVMTGTEEYSAIPAERAAAMKKINNPYNLDPKLFLGSLGMPGLTAYSSLYDIGKPKKGETIFISAASGAVGQIVGQIAKHEGLTVIGSVGNDEKLDFILKDLKFDAGFNYKKERPAEALPRLAPNGIDIYYENVGGDHLDAALAALKQFGRIVACGMISQYSLPEKERYGVKNLMMVVSKRLTMRGFIVSDADMGPKYTAEHQEKVMKWIHNGTFKVTTHVTDGIDNAAEGILGMLRGDNFGKAVLKISDIEA
ncbi:MAG: hypothetical protein MMC33_008827 [Icmadophila ericetorum]|nr:hypothetical protein [Icmadophila ericetorum]